MVSSVKSVSAQNLFSKSQDGIVQKMTQKFGLKENDVKAAFNEERQDRQTQMQKAYEDRLSQAVKDGKITEAQKQLILAKHKEMQQKNEERRSAMEKERENLSNWATQNNIDLQYVQGGGPGMGGGRMMFGR